jgi:hypothetical protein
MVDLTLVNGAAGCVGGIGRTITELPLKQGKAVRAIVRNEDQQCPKLLGAVKFQPGALSIQSLSIDDVRNEKSF